MAVGFTINVGFHSYFWHVHAKWGLGNASKISDHLRTTFNPTYDLACIKHSFFRLSALDLEWKVHFNLPRA